MSTTLLIRKSTKQAWSQAAEVEMLDSVQSLANKVEGMNEESGFAKFQVLWPADYTVATDTGVVIAEVEHHDITEEAN